MAGDETPEQRDATLDVAIPLLADDPRPRYLMGLGSPADLLEAVHRGVDLFDSVLPARVARNGQLWVPGGRLNLRNQRFLDDPAPIQEDCPCIACRGFSRAYLAHLFRADELRESVPTATIGASESVPVQAGATPNAFRQPEPAAAAQA